MCYAYILKILHDNNRKIVRYVNDIRCLPNFIVIRSFDPIILWSASRLQQHPVRSVKANLNTVRKRLGR